MTSIVDFQTIIISLTALFQSFTALETEKLEAVREKNLETLNECIKNEQVQILKLKGLDKKREQAQAALGFEALTFREIIEKLPEEQQKEVSPHYLALQRATAEFKAVNESVKTALDVNLHVIDGSLRDLGIDPGTDPTSGNNLKNRFA